MRLETTIELALGRQLATRSTRAIEDPGNSRSEDD